jgi:hypothetical protein
MPCNGFLHFGQCASLRDLSLRSMLWLDIIDLVARLRGNAIAGYEEGALSLPCNNMMAALRAFLGGE